MLRCGTAILCVAGLVCAWAAVASATSYTFYDLGSASDSTAAGAGSSAYGINSSNEVTGRYYPASGSYAAIWNLSGGVYTRTTVPALNGGATGWGNAINNYGTVVGQSSASSPTGNRAFSWVPGTANGTSGTLTDVGLKMNTGGSTSSSRLEAVNSAGQSVGYANGTGAGAYYWDGVSSSATLIPMGTGNTNAFSFGSGINDSRLVAGTLVTGGADNACTWQASTPSTPAVDIDPFIKAALAPPGDGEATFAVGVNNAAEIVGWDLIDIDTDGIPFLYQDSTHIYNLGLAEPSTMNGKGHALAISGTGTVVGYGEMLSNGAYHAFVWTPSITDGNSGTMVDLNSVVTLPAALSNAGYYFYEATGVNSSGSVVGLLFNGTSYRAFAVVPPTTTPEPSTLLLAASGLAGLLAYAWRKRK